MDQNRIDDQCHMFIYRHPPRSRQIKLAENVHSLLVNEYHKNNHKLYTPSWNYKSDGYYNANDGLLKLLISEVKSIILELICA